MNKTKLFQVGDFCFFLSYPTEIIPPDNFMTFAVSQGKASYFYTISLSCSIQRPDKSAIANREDIVIYSNQEFEWRLIGSKGRKGFYALYRENGNNCAKIQLSEEKIQDIHFDTVFASLFALERHMIKRDSLILHCAYTVYKGKAILFSAPSGIGKSTQAELWKQYRGSRIVNGDRALLRKIDGAWSACGWPVCGSSDICESEDTPLYTIVMLRQGETNYIERLSPIQAFTQLYAQTTINQWNPAFVQRAMELIEDLIGQVPVYQLTCNMTEDAVKCLEQAIFPEANTVEDDIEP